MPRFLERDEARDAARVSLRVGRCRRGASLRATEKTIVGRCLLACLRLKKPTNGRQVFLNVPMSRQIDAEEKRTSRSAQELEDAMAGVRQL